jgi:hypothetical protein
VLAVALGAASTAARRSESFLGKDLQFFYDGGSVDDRCVCLRCLIRGVGVEIERLGCEDCTVSKRSSLPV